MVQKLIHERIQQDSSALQRQLASAKSVQTRLRSLESNVDDLSHALLDPEVFAIFLLSSFFTRRLITRLLSQDRTRSKTDQDIIRTCGTRSDCVECSRCLHNCVSFTTMPDIIQCILSVSCRWRSPRGGKAFRRTDKVAGRPATSIG
jgi:hypothetical protein